MAKKRSTLTNTEVENHFSAKEFPIQVQKFLTDEIEKGAIIGPFHSPPHPDMHCSPLLSRPKDGNDRRIVLDLSYPKGKSVNVLVNKESYDGIAYKLKFPSTDHICEAISQYDDPYISKIDISRAFRQLRIDPADALKLGIVWKGQFFIDTHCAFGFVHSSGIYTLLSQLIEHIMRSEGHKMFGYLDDYVLVSDYTNAETSFRALYELLLELGLPINPKKICPPAKCMPCLGIYFNLNDFSIAITDEKISGIIDCICEVMNKKSLTKKQYQSLTGRLLYIHRCVKPARIFVNRILALFRKNHNKKRITLTEDFHADIQWFAQFLEVFNGKAIFQKHQTEIESVYI